MESGNADTNRTEPSKSSRTRSQERMRNPNEYLCRNLHLAKYDIKLCL